MLNNLNICIHYLENEMKNWRSRNISKKLDIRTRMKQCLIQARYGNKINYNEGQWIICVLKKEDYYLSIEKPRKL